MENESAARLPLDVKAAGGAERKRDEYYCEPRPDVQALVDARGKRILDVGCAAGELGAALKRAGAREVVGVEASAEAAAQARAKLDRVIVGDAQSPDLPLDSAGFDVVILADVLEHLVDPWAALASFSRYLRADGRVVASIPNMRFYAVIARLVFNRWGYRESGILDRTHLRFFTWPTIKEMFEGAGLRIERVRPVYRLLEDQSRVGRVGALASRWFCRLVAPLILWRHFFTFQYLIVARKSDD
ncbi:MAG TPA: class I SAM-dependent methyltransferase [Blastocatellia bacterium]|nr:class I SAM-dependent methyltransferase [Blastocatellia bacterium]